VLKLKKYRVRRSVPSPVRVLDQLPHSERFFSLYGKNLSPCGVFNGIDAKHQQRPAVFPVQELAKDRLFIFWLEDLPHDEIFLPSGEKNPSPCGNLSRTRTRLGAKRRTLYLLNFKIRTKILKFKIFRRIARKFPAMQ
jgi:hypothetical protein